jgi:hypothetical protein
METRTEEHKQRGMVGGKENKKLRRMTENMLRILKKLRYKNSIIRKIRLKSREQIKSAMKKDKQR